MPGFQGPCCCVVLHEVRCGDAGVQSSSLCEIGLKALRFLAACSKCPSTPCYAPGVGVLGSTQRDTTHKVANLFHPQGPIVCPQAHSGTPNSPPPTKAHTYALRCATRFTSERFTTPEPALAAPFKLKPLDLESVEQHGTAAGNTAAGAVQGGHLRSSLSFCIRQGPRWLPYSRYSAGCAHPQDAFGKGDLVNAETLLGQLKVGSTWQAAFTSTWPALHLSGLNVVHLHCC